jgi:lipopolysaccharide transport system ATP-binding protein
MEPVIEIKNVGKKYVINHQRGSYVALRDILANVLKNPLGFAKHKAKQAMGLETKEDFWALKNINIKINEGEIVGIIGHNGAGKSTLLKILTGITPPTEGEIIMRGRVASLLEVGTGFHPELTGRENIFLNGAILGMTKKEIVNKFDEIVAFAGVEKFLDTPVKYYSSGMYVRLAFSVAAHMEPDILLVDEVLAVGDADFQKKSLAKMEEVTKTTGRTILLVSHNMSAIESLCKHTILLEKGQVKMAGLTKDVIEAYIGGDGSNMNTEWTGKAGNDDATLVKTWVKSLDPKGIFHTASKLEIGIEVEVHKPIPGFILGMSLWSEFNYPLVFRLYDDESDESAPQTVAPGKFIKKFIIPENTLALGAYYVSIFMGVYGRKMILGSLQRRTPQGELRFELKNISGIGRQSNPINEFGQSSIFRPDWEVI